MYIGKKEAYSVVIHRQHNKRTALQLSEFRAKLWDTGLIFRNHLYLQQTTANLK